MLGSPFGQVFRVIKTHLSCRFHLAVDFLGLRRSESWSQIIDQAQCFSERVPRHRHLGQLERDVPRVTDDLGTDLHQLFPQRAQRPFNVGYWLGAELARWGAECPLVARSGHSPTQ